MEGAAAAEYVEAMAIALLRAPFLAFVAGSALAGWAVHEWTTDPALLRRIEELEKEAESLRKRITFLRERERVAQIEVIKQSPERDAEGQRRTTFRFQEYGLDGAPLGQAREFTIDGDLLYVDAQVIKFDDAFLEEHELERGTTLLLFRRLFGEYQAPADGFALDSSPRVPSVYSAEDAVDPFIGELWENFWEYANRPEVLERTGVRAMHGEAPYIRLEPSSRYQVELRSSDGLTIRALREP